MQKILRSGLLVMVLSSVIFVVWSLTKVSPAKPTLREQVVQSVEGYVDTVTSWVTGNVQQ